MKKHRWWKEWTNSYYMHELNKIHALAHQFLYTILVRGWHKWPDYNILSLSSMTFTSSNDIAARSLGLVLRDRVLFSNASRLRQNLWIPYPISETTTHRASLRFLCLSPAVREPRKSSSVMRGGIVPIDAAVASLGAGRDCYDEWSEYFGESSVLASMLLCRLVANRWTSNKSGKRVRAAKRVAGESTVSRLRGLTFEHRNFQRRGSRFSDVFNEF